MTPTEQKLREALRIALKELDDMATFLHIHNATPKHWPIKELVEAKAMLAVPESVEKPQGNLEEYKQWAEPQYVTPGIPYSLPTNQGDKS